MIDSCSIDGTALTVVDLKGLGSPAPRRSAFARAERHGSIDRTRFYEGRVLELEGLVRGADAWDTFDALKQAFALGAERTLRFRRTGRSEDEQVTVRVASPLDDATRPGATLIRYGVSLFAGDPRIYGAALKSGSYDPTESLSGGGVTFPLTFDLEFSTTTATHLELANEGNFSSPPVLTIAGPVIDPIIDNDTVGESIAFDTVLGDADTLVVDVAARSVLLNGAERLDLLVVADTTDWWELAPGTNRLRLRGTGMEAGSTELTCQYRDARI
jgi:hypothetical protein